MISVSQVRKLRVTEVEYLSTVIQIISKLNWDKMMIMAATVNYIFTIS